MKSDIDNGRGHAEAPQHHRARASIERTVEWVDTDASGHQHNSAIMRWVEAAEAQLVRGLGLDDYFPAAPRVRQEINYRAKLWFGQPVTATVTVVRMGRSSMTYAFEVVGSPFADHPGGAAADGTVTVVHVPAGSSTGSPWPEPLRAALAPEVPTGLVGIADDVETAST